MRFPVEVVPDRSEEIVEVRNVIAQLIGHRLQLVGIGDHLMRGADHLFRQCCSMRLTMAIVFVIVVGLHQQVVHSILLERHQMGLRARCSCC